MREQDDRIDDINAPKSGPRSERRDSLDSLKTFASRRGALARLGALGVLAGTSSLISACGGGSGSSSASDATAGGTSVKPAPAPAPSSPPAPASPPAVVSPAVIKLQATFNTWTPLTVSPSTVTVAQEAASNQGDPLSGPTAQILPAPMGAAVNPNPVSLATLPQIWGYRRDLWVEQPAGFFGTLPSDQSWFVPVSIDHTGATENSNGVCGMHFIFTGQAFEVLFAGTNLQITLIADGQYAAPQFITTTITGGVVGAPLASVNAYVSFDFGSQATRHISLYATDSQGPCALAIGPQDTIVPWDRSAEPSFSVMSDSYGQSVSQNWGSSGPYWEAAALLGLPHIDHNAIGGTGYAPNNTNSDTRNPGNDFVARLATSTPFGSDLFLTAGSLNDDNSIAAPPLYATGAQALAAFDNAVSEYFNNLRAALPNAVLAALGPWAPVQSIPTSPVAESKLLTIKAALEAVGGPWVMLDNLNGGWTNSSGASGNGAEGPWQTGTGNVGDPKGDGNGDIYISADGVHPTVAGCVYLGEKIATNLKAAILAL